MNASQSHGMILMVPGEYQDATTSTYSPTMSEIPLKGELDNHIPPCSYTYVG